VQPAFGQAPLEVFERDLDVATAERRLPGLRSAAIGQLASFNDV
jgi:hypothetical protein